MNTYETVQTGIGCYYITRITNNGNGTMTITKITRWYANVLPDIVTVKTVTVKTVAVK